MAGGDTSERSPHQSTSVSADVHPFPAALAGAQRMTVGEVEIEAADRDGFGV